MAAGDHGVMRRTDHMWRRIADIVLIGAASASLGAAASVSFSSSTLGAARMATPRCTAAGLTVFQNLSGVNVISVTVGGLPPACGTATLQVTLDNGAANASGSAAVPAGGGSVTVTLGSALAVAVADQVDLVLVGP
jgi:hypothetical protein